jgi:hypothetical protein
MPEHAGRIFDIPAKRASLSIAANSAESAYRQDIRASRAANLQFELVTQWNQEHDRQGARGNRGLNLKASRTEQAWMWQAAGECESDFTENGQA